MIGVLAISRSKEPPRPLGEVGDWRGRRESGLKVTTTPLAREIVASDYQTIRKSKEEHQRDEGAGEKKGNSPKTDRGERETGDCWHT